MITVFTPTYNRKDKLEQLYDSLLKQGDANFEWLIVDDGSADNTKTYIDGLKKDNKIKINYYYKENGGKQSAYNFGLDKVLGDVFLCIDSDDILKDNILSEIEKEFSCLDDKVGGVMYNQGYINDKEKVIGTIFPDDNLIDSYFNIYNNYNVTGDKLIVLKMDVARDYYFPMIDGEKFVPEALIFNRISLQYQFKCINKIAAYKEYLDSGYSANYFDLVKRNPKGNALYFKELYNLKPSLYNVYGYLLFSFYAKEKFKNIIKHPNKFLVLLLFIPVWIIAMVRK